MYDAASPSDRVRLQRATGELRVGVRRRGDATALEDLRQAGCLKARFPRPIVPGWLDVGTLNPGGGVAGGDRLDLAVTAAPDTQVVVAAQAAERFYRAAHGDSASTVRAYLTVAAGA